MTVDHLDFSKKDWLSKNQWAYLLRVLFMSEGRGAIIEAESSLCFEVSFLRLKACSCLIVTPIRWASAARGWRGGKALWFLVARLGFGCAFNRDCSERILLVWGLLGSAVMRGRKHWEEGRLLSRSLRLRGNHAEVEAFLLLVLLCFLQSGKAA